MARVKTFLSGFIMCLALLGASPCAAQQTPGSSAPAGPATPAAPVTPAEPPKAQPEIKAPVAAPVPAAPAEDMTKPSADASNAAELKLTAKPVLILRGQATWDEGYEALMKAFKTLRSEAGRLGVAHVGKPQTMFTDTNDQSFKYEAMLTLEKEPDAALKPQGGMSFGKSPEGRAFVFKHVGAYDDIDSVYEAITAWLDEKNLTAKGSFLEEYLNEPQGSDDALLELNIYVFVQ